MNKALEWIKEEAIKAIPSAIYFIITFNLVNLTQRLMMHGEGLTVGYTSYLEATIGALIVVKILLIVNAFSFINRFPNKPMIYNITWKFFIYGIAVLLFRIIEDFIHLAFHFDDMQLAMHHLAIKLDFPTFWAVQVWILMLFTGYIVASEFTRVLGKDDVKKLILGP